MKLGGSICTRFQTPAEWGALLKASRFASVTCPLNHETPRDVAQGYFDEAARLGVVVAEIGAWSNPMSPNDAERQTALTSIKNQLAFGDEMGIPCCVNIVGSRGEVWDGPYRDNYAPDTYDAIVQSIREIIDAVKPTRCRYTIEPMPWMVPDGPDEYLQLIRDVDRAMFGVHLDFVNMINSPKRFLFANEFIDECLKKLGPHIVSIHAKDISLEQRLTVIMRETAPPKGSLDYAHILRSIDNLLPKSMPVLLEHMQTDAEYAEAFEYVAGVAAGEGIQIR